MSNAREEHAAMKESEQQWVIDNIYTIARREARRAFDGKPLRPEMWSHVVRLCERVEAGERVVGVLREGICGEVERLTTEIKLLGLTNDRLRLSWREDTAHERVRAERSEAQVQELRTALASLRNECRGLIGAFRPGIVEVTSVTNVRVLERKIADADAALSATPPQEP